MEYRKFGNTGMNISRLGFGAMRLPMMTVDEKRVVNDELAIPMIHRAFELGVNYIDTAWMYCDHFSEYTVGKALKGWRDKVYLSTKYPFNAPLMETLEKQLKKLDVDYIDVYHFHGIGEKTMEKDTWESAVADGLRAKELGLIKHLSFSFHDKPEVMMKLIDLGVFSSVLCQYNFLDRSNEAGMAYAKEKGLGTVVMGPIGGGRIAGMDPAVAKELGVEVKSSAELALRFVFANPNVDCVISGMGTMEMVEENCTVASNSAPLSDAEVTGINAAMEENKRLAELYCTGCNYCIPYCPQEVNISRIFSAMNQYRIYKIKDPAQKLYDEIGEKEWVKGKKADACVECGLCEEHCPQKIEIRKQLKECAAVFGK